MLDIRDLAMDYGSGPVLDGLDLTLAGATGALITGLSGCGKTTLLRLIAGLEYPGRGEIRLGGEPASTPDRLIPPHRRGIGFVFEEPALWPHLTVAGNIGFGLAALPRRERDRRVAAWLETVGLADLGSRRPHQLSAGQARRVSLARALAPEPRLLLLDEPFANVDAGLRERLEQAVLDEAARRGMGYLYVSHIETRLSLAASARYRMRNGRLVAG